MICSVYKVLSKVSYQEIDLVVNDDDDVVHA